MEKLKKPMALKRNRYIAIVLFLPFILEAQLVADTVMPVIYQAEQQYNDSDQVRQNNKYLEQGLNKSDWESLSEGLDFTEDSVKKKKRQDGDSTNKSKVNKTIVNQDLGRLKYVWLMLIIGIIIAVLVFLWPYFKSTSDKKSVNLEIEDEQPEEATLREANLKQALDEAISKGDYRLAFRIRYLEVLQQMVLNNIIDYRKERTNMDYLKQISDKELYSLFRQLTLYFEEVWYGEKHAEKSSFERMSELVTQINTIINTR